MDFKVEGDVIYMIGESRNDINSSEYLHKIVGQEYSPAPYFNLDEEFYMQQVVLTLARKKLVASAHDISEGGLFICLAESGFNRNLGFKVNQNEMTIRKDAYLFGEAQGRVVVTVTQKQQNDFVKFMSGQNVPFTELGKVTADEISFFDENWGSIHAWKKKYDDAITVLLKGQENEQALHAI